MRLCRTGKHGDTMRDGIPIFFSSCGKENGHSWSKEKTLRGELTGKAVNSPQSGGWPSRTANQIRKSPAGCAIPEYQIGISPHLRVGTEHNGVQNRIGVFLLSCVPLRYALPGPFSALSSFLVLRPLGGWFFLPRPSSPGGVSKGEGPQSRPFVPRGGMGDGWRPPCFGWGSKGEGPLR